MKTRFAWSKLQHKCKIKLCSACLSQDRNVCSLGDFKEIYNNLCININLNNKTETMLCWECMSLLRNVKDFQEKVKKSQILLDKITKENCSPKTLSNLIISETLTLDTFEEAEDYLHADAEEKRNDYVPDFNEDKLIKCKEEMDVEYIKEAENDLKSLENKIDLQLLGQILKDDQNDTDLKLENKIQKPKINNYPKERNKQYIMMYQSLKYEDAVQKIKINDTELKKWLERERNSEHFMKLRNKCDICLQKLKMNESVYRHKKDCHTLTESHPFMCNICNTVYSRKPLLAAHIKRHYFARRCNICNYECYSSLNMSYHLRNTHRTTVVCIHCEECFKNARDFYVHLRTHTTVDYYFCDQCDKKTKTLEFLEKHIKRYHMPQHCEECNFTFKSHKQLARHNRYKHTYNPTEESFCVSCDKQFRSVYMYKMHLLTAAVHLQEKGIQRKKEVPCPVCLKIYMKRETMLNHYRWVHTNNSKYRCEQCDKSFLNRTKYKDHMQYFHLGVPKPKNKLCKFCNKGFTTNQTLSNHMLIHTGEKPHSCPHCLQRFRQKSAMQSHIKTMHNKSLSQQDELYVVIPFGDDSMTTQGSEDFLFNE